MTVPLKSRRLVPLLVLLAGSFALVSAEEVSDEPEFVVGLEVKERKSGRPPDRRPELTRISYEIDVFGGVALGRLVQTFDNPGSRDLVGTYEISIENGPRLTGLEVEQDGEIRELASKEVEPAARRGVRSAARESVSRHVMRDRLRAELESLHPAPTYKTGYLPTAPRTGEVRSKSFGIERREAILVHSRFRSPMQLTDRTLLLRLPGVREATRPEGPVVAGLGDGASPIPAGIVVRVHHDQPLRLARSSTHEIVVEFAADRTIIEAVGDEIPADRVFELEIALSTEVEPAVTGYVQKGEDGLHRVEALVTPPSEIADESVRPKELLFLLDSSGSMGRDEKIEQARRAVSWCVGQLRDVDRFNIVEFDTEFTVMSPRPVDPAQFERKLVDRWLEGVQAGGGTRLLPALEAALDLEEDLERHRMVVVVSDGILADESEVLGLLEEKLGEGRLFVVGTGKDLRQDTLFRLAEYGRGAVTFAGTAGELESAVAELFETISRPVGWDVDLYWAGAEVEEILPSRLPDLYAGRPVRVLAWIRGDLPDAVRIRMSAMDGKHLYDVKLPPRVP